MICRLIAIYLWPVCLLVNKFKPSKIAVFLLVWSKLWCFEFMAKFLLWKSSRIKLTTSTIFEQLRIYQTLVCRILHKYNFKAYKIHMVQELSKNNYGLRVEFCDLLMENINNNTFRLNNIGNFGCQTTFQLAAILDGLR